MPTIGYYRNCTCREGTRDAWRCSRFYESTSGNASGRLFPSLHRRRGYRTAYSIGIPAHARSRARWPREWPARAVAGGPSEIEWRRMSSLSLPRGPAAGGVVRMPICISGAVVPVANRSPPRAPPPPFSSRSLARTQSRMCRREDLQEAQASVREGASRCRAEDCGRVWAP